MRKLVFLALISVLTFGCNSSVEPPKLDPGAVTNTEISDSGVMLVRYNPGSESTTQREEGFLAELKENYPEITVISSDQYAGTTPESSLTMANQLLGKYKDKMTGVFAVCEPNADGMLRSMRDNELAGKRVFVGFDPNERMVAAMGEGHMNGIVLQDPVMMGNLAVKTVVAHLNGETVEKRISTGEHCATPDNMKTEEMQRLLHPPQFSGEPFKPTETKYKIAVLPKGLTHEFWQSVRYGAEEAAKELGNVEILWDGPQTEGSVEQQIALVQGMITKGAHGICLAPNDSQGLAAAVKGAQEKNVPVVIYDSGIELSPDEYVSYVATDNFAGGRLAAKCLGDALAAKATDVSAAAAESDTPSAE